MRFMNTAFQESESGSALSPLNKARNDSTYQIVYEGLRR